MSKSPDAFRTISEVADWLGVQAHVLRFWESKFAQIKPVKRAGGRRYYRPADMLLLGGIKKLLYEDGLTIKGAQKMLREKGVAFVADQSAPLDDLTMAVLDAGTETSVRSQEGSVHKAGEAVATPEPELQDEPPNRQDPPADDIELPGNSSLGAKGGPDFTDAETSDPPLPEPEAASDAAPKPLGEVGFLQPSAGMEALPPSEAAAEQPGGSQQDVPDGETVDEPATQVGTEPERVDEETVSDVKDAVPFSPEDAPEDAAPAEMPESAIMESAPEPEVQSEKSETANPSPTAFSSRRAKAPEPAGDAPPENDTSQASSPAPAGKAATPEEPEQSALPFTEDEAPQATTNSSTERLPDNDASEATDAGLLPETGSEAASDPLAQPSADASAGEKKPFRVTVPEADAPPKKPRVIAVALPDETKIDAKPRLLTAVSRASGLAPEKQAALHAIVSRLVAYRDKLAAADPDRAKD